MQVQNRVIKVTVINEYSETIEAARRQLSCTVEGESWEKWITDYQEFYLKIQ